MTPLELATQAWNAVKSPEDNPFDLLPMDMRHKLIALAIKAQFGKKAQEGDYAPVGFMEKVAELAVPELSRVVVNESAFENPIPEFITTEHDDFPSLHPESAAHLSNEIFIPDSKSKKESKKGKK